MKAKVWCTKAKRAPFTQLAVLLMLFTSHAFSQVWTQLAPVGTPPPTVGLAGFDAANNRMVALAQDPLHVWVLTNANGLGAIPQWLSFATLPDTGSGFPTGLANTSWVASAVYDATNNRMITFGGCLAHCGSPVNDTWVLTNANGLGGTPTWLKLVPGGPLPSPRANHAAVYDSTSNRMIVFGGQNGCCAFPVTFGDVWVLSNANGLGGSPTWTLLSTSGGPPPGQADTKSTYDSASNRMTVYGGIPNGSLAITNAVWVLSNANGTGGIPAWTNLIAEGSAGIPPARVDFGLVHDPNVNRMTIFGGMADEVTGLPLYSDTWVLTGANGPTAAWTQLLPSGGPPVVRRIPFMVLDVATNRIIMSGGVNDCCILADTWVLALGPPPDTVGPITSNVTVSPNPVAVNTNSTLGATVDDSTTGGSNIASAYYSTDGGTSYQQMLLTPNTSVTTQASASLAPFPLSNVYNVCVHGTDAPGNTGADACVLLPVYDPNGSFVTGGGQVASPSGADLLNTAAAGQATFGFVSKYLPGRNVPSGNLEFQFKEGNLNFKSTSMDWLVVTGEPRAKFHGTGIVNGTNVCNFEVDAWAGSFTGNVDAFGLKISSCANGGDRYSLPATKLTKGNIIIHK